MATWKYPSDRNCSGPWALPFPSCAAREGACQDSPASPATTTPKTCRSISSAVQKSQQPPRDRSGISRSMGHDDRLMARGRTAASLNKSLHRAPARNSSPLWIWRKRKMVRRERREKDPSVAVSWKVTLGIICGVLSLSHAPGKRRKSDKQQPVMARQRPTCRESHMPQGVIASENATVASAGIRPAAHVTG